MHEYGIQINLWSTWTIDYMNLNKEYMIKRLYEPLE